MDFWWFTYLCAVRLDGAVPVSSFLGPKNLLLGRKRMQGTQCFGMTVIIAATCLRAMHIPDMQGDEYPGVWLALL